jgi:hypothetical protein
MCAVTPKAVTEAIGKVVPNLRDAFTMERGSVVCVHRSPRRLLGKVTAAHENQHAINSIAVLNGDAKNRRQWTAAELHDLETWASTLSIGEMSRRLHRSERALRCQLHRLGLSAKVREGWGLNELCVGLHVSRRKILRAAAQGHLHVGSAQVSATHASKLNPRLNAHMRRARTIPIREAARLLRWSHKQILIAALAGRCRLINVRISDASVMRWRVSQVSTTIRPSHGTDVDRGRSQAEWSDAQRERDRSPPHHFGVVHHCLCCGRYIRGIAFFRHQSFCKVTKKRSMGSVATKS